jgi:hypothetical protein
MGHHATAKRSAINLHFEAFGGDLKRDGAEPILVETRATKQLVISAEVSPRDDTLHVRYSILEAALDDDDAARILSIAYLDALTGHSWRNEVRGRYPRAHLRLTNADSGASTTIRYPDPE